MKYLHRTIIIKLKLYSLEIEERFSSVELIFYVHAILLKIAEEYIFFYFGRKLPSVFLYNCMIEYN